MTAALDVVWLDEAPEFDSYEPGLAFFIDPDWKLWDAYEMNPALTRRPIVVVLPSNLDRYPIVPFPIDSRSTESKSFWTVTVVEATLIAGQKPDITVSPSIDIKGGYYHGFLTNGVVGPG